MLSRRDFVGGLAAGATVACAAGLGRAEALSVRDSEQSAETVAAQSQNEPAAEFSAQPAAPWDLISPLTAGAVVGHGWRVTDLSSITHGSCVLTLENERGRAHRVHVCGNAGSPQGVVFTPRLDLVVMNGGQGDMPTDEGFAQAVAEVAHVLAANETQQPEVISALLPHAERVARFTGSAQLR